MEISLLYYLRKTKKENMHLQRKSAIWSMQDRKERLLENGMKKFNLIRSLESVIIERIWKL